MNRAEAGRAYDATMALYEVAEEVRKPGLAIKALKLIEEYHYLPHPPTLKFFELHFWAGGCRDKDAPQKAI